MMQAVFASDAGVVAVSAALRPFAWQSFTAAAVCRRAVAAMDAAGVFARRSPHLRSEECVEALVEALTGCRWRLFTVEGLSRFLVGSALAWQQERAWFDIRLGLLLDGMG